MRVMRRQFVLSIAAVSLALSSFPKITLGQVRGPVTNLPIPRFVSLKASKANAAWTVIVTSYRLGFYTQTHAA